MPIGPPTEIRLVSAEKRLDITFADATRDSLPAEYLRVESPSAEVQGHTPSERRVVAGARNVGIRALEPVGHYAIRVVFDDGHDTGIYTWDYLHDLARERDARWARYLDELAARGLRRDR